MLTVFALGLAWSLIRYSFLSPRISQAAASFVVILKWPAVIGSSGWLILHRQYTAAVVALIWPFVSALCSMPGKVGIIELALAKCIGLAPPGATL